METKDILNFKTKIKDFSLEELKEEKAKLDQEINKMILNSDLIVKAAILTSAIEEKEGK